MVWKKKRELKIEFAPLDKALLEKRRRELSWIRAILRETSEGTSY